MTTNNGNDNRLIKDLVNDMLEHSTKGNSMLEMLKAMPEGLQKMALDTLEEALRETIVKESIDQSIIYTRDHTTKGYQTLCFVMMGDQYTKKSQETTPIKYGQIVTLMNGPIGPIEAEVLRNELVDKAVELTAMFDLPIPKLPTWR